MERYRSKLLNVYKELKTPTFNVNMGNGFFTWIVVILMTGFGKSLESKVVLKDFILKE